MEVGVVHFKGLFCEPSPRTASPQHFMSRWDTLNNEKTPELTVVQPLVATFFQVEGTE
jgi:hypothetical protein